MSISQEKQNHIRIGVDLGGTKIEFVALERDGRELHRHRIATPRFDYEGTVQAVAHAAAGELRSMAVCTAVRMELPANGDTTHCRGCGRRNFPAQRVIAGGVAASKRGFPERAWKWITSAQQAFLSRALRSSREAPQ